MNRKFLTVAELVARERSTTQQSYPWAQQDRRPRALTPAGELLRREGVRIDGMADTAPTQQVHVHKLLSREGELPEPMRAKVKPAAKQRPEEPRKKQRAAAIGSAAALCGLTIAGLIALKPATGGHDNASASGEHGGTGSDIAPTKVSPTTTVLKRASNNQDAQKSLGSGGASPQSSAPSAPSSGAAGTPAGGGSTGTPSDDQTTTPPSDDPAPPTQSSSPKPPDDEKPKPPPNDGGDDEDDGGGGLLDPILDPVGDLLDPVKGTVSGTLDGLTP